MAVRVRGGGERGGLKRLGKKSKYGSLGMPIITLYKLDEATDLSPPSPQRGLQMLQSEHMTWIPRRASHLNLRLKSGEKLQCGFSVEQKCK